MVADGCLVVDGWLIIAPGVMEWLADERVIIYERHATRYTLRHTLHTYSYILY